MELPAPRWAALRNRPLMTLTLGHATVDSYVGLLPMLYPLLIQQFALDFKTVGLVSLAYTGMSSLSQPIFGWIADRYGTRWIGLALIWTATLFATVGFASSFPMLLALAALAGLGSGAYHPFGALTANAVIDGQQRNTAMSLYSSGGTFGVALGPLIGAVLFRFAGVRGTALMFIPGLCAALWMLAELRAPHAQRIAPKPVARPAGPLPILPLLAVMGVMMSRTWTVIGLEAFIPTWYQSLGYQETFYGPLATVVVLSSAFGVIGSGSLADRFGARTVIIGALVLTIPALILFALYPGPWAFASGILIGLSAASTTPLMLVMAQQLLAHRAGVASGIVLGLGFITGAIGVPITGAIADVYGFSIAILTQVGLVVLTIALAWFLPNEAYFQRRAAQQLGTESTG